MRIKRILEVHIMVVSRYSKNNIGEDLVIINEVDEDVDVNNRSR